jgi:hypothetical protein
MGNDCLQRDLGRGGYLPDRQQVMHTLINSTGDFRSFTRLLELSHDAIHRFIGGSMVMDNSADEPLFFVHHSFLDFLWDLWTDCSGYHLQVRDHPGGLDAIDFQDRQFTTLYTGERGEVGPYERPADTRVDRRMRFLGSTGRLSQPKVPRDVLLLSQLGVRYVHSDFLGHRPTRTWLRQSDEQCRWDNLDHDHGSSASSFEALSVEDDLDRFNRRCNREEIEARLFESPETFCCQFMQHRRYDFDDICDPMGSVGRGLDECDPLQLCCTQHHFRNCSNR